MKLSRRALTGKSYLATMTDLLHRIRREGAFAGLYEAADLQWWWREDDARVPDRQIFWFDEDDLPVACLLRRDKGEASNYDFPMLPSARPLLDAVLLPAVVATLAAMDRLATFSVREDDQVLRGMLEAAGFRQDPAAFILTELVDDPAQTSLPPGFTLTSRVEDDLPHHLIRRNGPHIADKLAECSLYRPDLDLCVRDHAGSVAAYALFWMDEVTYVGLLEPLRTEREFQRLGLARHLIAAGTARLRALGATSIRVGYSMENAAAAALYHTAGFEDRVRTLEYRRSP